MALDDGWEVECPTVLTRLSHIDRSMLGTSYQFGRFPGRLSNASGVPLCHPEATGALTDMDTENLRVLVFEYLRECTKNNRRDTLQWNNVFNAVSQRAKERFPQCRIAFCDQDGARLKHVIWDLIIERILVPSTSNPRSINDGWPFLSLTDHGRRVLEAQSPVPYDPDGYLASLKTTVPTVSDTVVEYLAEAVSTFRTGNHLASAVMLGAASEMVFIEVSHALPLVVADARKQQKLAAKMQNGKIKDRIATAVGWCRNNAAVLPDTWAGSEQIEDIERIADLIRRRRNEAGHPEAPPRRPSRDQMYSYLLVFPEYCKHLYVLKDWAIANAGCVS